MKYLFWPATLLARLILVVVGFALVIAGAAATLTGIGAFVGIPLLLIGLLLAARGLF
jgi:hypothetical protein